MLWSRLRGRRADKPTFRRQHPFGRIILDFYCPKARLAVEVDGATHWEDEARAKDEARDRWLFSQGIEVMRIPASRVFHNLSAVADGILLRAEARIAEQAAGSGPPPPPRPLRGVVPLPPLLRNGGGS